LDGRKVEDGRTVEDGRVVVVGTVVEKLDGIVAAKEDGMVVFD